MDHLKVETQVAVSRHRGTGLSLYSFLDNQHQMRYARTDGRTNGRTRRLIEGVGQRLKKPESSSKHVKSIAVIKAGATSGNSGIRKNFQKLKIKSSQSKESDLKLGVIQTRFKERWANRIMIFS